VRLHIVFVYGGLLLVHGLNPLKFFRGAAPGMQVAFASSASFASMPVAIRCVTHNLGVNRDYAAFAVPLGASIKMDGCGAIYPALASVFIAQYFGLELSLAQYFDRSCSPPCSAASAPPACPARPSSWPPSCSAPPDCRSKVSATWYAIDRILDMMRTMTNVTGQMLVPVLVAKQTGMLDRTIYAAASTDVALDEYKA
jgi:Na+/H+-dicarboxylate symporter